MSVAATSGYAERWPERIRTGRADWSAPTAGHGREDAYMEPRGQAPIREPWRPTAEEVARIREELRPVVAEAARRSAAIVKSVTPG